MAYSTNTVLHFKEWGKTIAFYRDQLKLPLIFATDWFVEFGLNAMSRLSIADEKRSSIKSCHGKGVTIPLEVNDIEAVRECSVKAGLMPTPLKSHPWDARVFYKCFYIRNCYLNRQISCSQAAPTRNQVKGRKA